MLVVLVALANLEIASAHTVEVCKFTIVRVPYCGLVYDPFFDDHVLRCYITYKIRQHCNKKQHTHILESEKDRNTRVLNEVETCIQRTVSSAITSCALNYESWAPLKTSIFWRV